MQTDEEKIAYIKRCVREEQIPYFPEDDFAFYLQKNGGNVNATIYELLCLKAEDSSITVSGLTTKDTSAYFRRLASRYKTYNSGVL